MDLFVHERPPSLPKLEGYSYPGFMRGANVGLPKASSNSKLMWAIHSRDMAELPSSRSTLSVGWVDDKTLLDDVESKTCIAKSN